MANLNVKVDSNIKKEADDITSGKVKRKKYQNVDDLFKDLETND